MSLREFVKKQWSDARLYTHGDARVGEFLEHFEEHPAECWETAVPLFRQKYYTLFDQVVPPLVNSSDKLLRLQLILHSDPSQPRELRMLREFVRHADPVADRPELKAIARLKHPALDKEIAGRPELVDALKPPAPVPSRPVTNVLRPPPPPAAPRPAAKKRARSKKGS